MMKHKLEMPLEQFAEAVAKENARLNEHNEKLKEQTKLYFHAFNKAIARIEKLEATQRDIIKAWDFWQSQETRSGFSELFASICEAKALEGKEPLEWTENYGQGSEPWLNKE